MQASYALPSTSFCPPSVLVRCYADKRVPREQQVLFQLCDDESVTVSCSIVLTWFARWGGGECKTGEKRATSCPLMLACSPRSERYTLQSFDFERHLAEGGAGKGAQGDKVRQRVTRTTLPKPESKREQRDSLHSRFEMYRYHAPTIQTSGRTLKILSWSKTPSASTQSGTREYPPCQKWRKMLSNKRVCY